MISKLIESINQIDQRFYAVQNPRTRNGVETHYSQEVVNPENRFVCELHRLLTNSIESNSVVIEL